MSDKELVKKGVQRIEWAGERMPVLKEIAERWKKEKPLQGLRLGACLHVTTETANLMLTLKEGGAILGLCASNPLSTQDDVAAALNEVYQIPTHAVHGADRDTYYGHINAVLDMGPNITMDDGADLINVLHTERQDLVKNVIGGTEETTTGVIRLKAMEQAGVLKYPVIAVNDAHTKYLFDNRYGTGQSTLDGIMRATNHLVAGTVFVVVGYGWCGKGVARRAAGLGANVAVVEVDPFKQLEAVMDGFRAMDMKQAAEVGEIFVTVTGDINAIDAEHLALMKDGAILANSGHFNVEINLEALAKMAIGRREVRGNVEEFKLPDGRRLYVLAEGRLVNLASAEGHPAHVMDMSFANQALSAEWMSRNAENLERRVYKVPDELDEMVARLKLKSMGVKLQELTEEQKRYLASFEMGTT
ncbi:MAG: adenosylhomocysteinase [Firmicutes bacterium]|nr:adenosylhomocysteinase [Bacillota bacterium]